MAMAEKVLQFGYNQYEIAFLNPEQSRSPPISNYFSYRFVPSLLWLVLLEHGTTTRYPWPHNVDMLKMNLKKKKKKKKKRM